MHAAQYRKATSWCFEFWRVPLECRRHASGSPGLSPGSAWEEHLQAHRGLLVPRPEYLPIVNDNGSLVQAQPFRLLRMKPQNTWLDCNSWDGLRRCITHAQGIFLALRVGCLLA